MCPGNGWPSGEGGPAAQVLDGAPAAWLLHKCSVKKHKEQLLVPALVVCAVLPKATAFDRASRPC